jgi:hypothetical protein
MCIEASPDCACISWSLPVAVCLCACVCICLHPHSLKGLQPVDEIKLPDGTVLWEAPTLGAAAAAGGVTVTAQLQQEAQRLQTATDMREWLR